MSIFSDAVINPQSFVSRYQYPKGSATLNAAASTRELQEKYNVEVISLTLGQPDGEPIINKPKGDVDNKYAAVQGKPELRKKIAQFESKIRGVDISSENIHLTNGGKQALDNVFSIYLGEGDKVLCPDLKWVSYKEQILDKGADLIEVETSETGLINIDEFQKSLNQYKPKLVLINSPSNPTGNCYLKKDREKICKMALDYIESDNRDLIILFDDIYKLINFEDEFLNKAPFENQLLKAGDYEKQLMRKGAVIYADGFAKAFKAMGWRVGYNIASAEIIDRIKAKQSNICSGISNASQQMALEALEYVEKKPSYFSDNNKIFKARRDYFKSQLENINNIKICGEPSGAFYIFIDVSKFFGMKIPDKIEDASGQVLKVENLKNFENKDKADRQGELLYLNKTIENSQDLADYLLFIAHIGVVAQDQKYIRISYATEMSNLEKASKLLEKYLMIFSS